MQRNLTADAILRILNLNKPLDQREESWRVLVVDDTALKMIQQLLRPSDLREHRVTVYL